MVLLDVNVIVNAMRTDAPRHAKVSRYVEGVRAGPEPFGLSDVALSGALRVLTHPRTFKTPTPQPLALAFVTALRNTPNAVTLSPGSRHWEIFDVLLVHSRATGNLISDAWYAALAIEHGCEFVTDDSDFTRFKGLRVRRPG